MTGPPPPAQPSDRILRGAAPAVLTVVGCVLVVAGLFLPWLRSGSVDRNSFEVAGVLDRLNRIRNGSLSWLPEVWPVVAVVTLLPVVLVVIGRHRWAGGSALVIGALALLLGVVTLVLGAGRASAGIRLAPLGPAVLAAGAVALLVAGVMLLRRRRPQGFVGVRR